MDSLLSFGKSLQEFENQGDDYVFTDASHYPQFFNKHLVHPRRKIKVFIDDPNANIRAFYFQYLVLCFEIENPNSEFYLNKIQKIIVDPNFSFLFLQDDNEAIFNDKQFKRFLLQFLEILEAGQIDMVQSAINKYPIMDLVLVYFFRSLIIYAGITEDFDSYIDRNILFGFFMESFNIDVAIFEQKCLKFFQAEVFLYEQSPQMIYLVYKELQNEEPILNPSNQTPSNKNSNLYSEKSGVQRNISVLEDYQMISDQSLGSKRNKNQQISHQQYFQQIVKQSNQNQINSQNLKNFKKEQASSISNDYYTLPNENQSYGINTKNDRLSQYNQKIDEIINTINHQGRTTRATTIITEGSPKYFSNDIMVERPPRYSYYESNNVNVGINNFQNKYSQRNNCYQQRYQPQNYNKREKIQVSIHDEKQIGSHRKISLSGKTTLTKDHRFSQQIMEKLNISKEFTDSFTLAKMGEPYRTQIKTIKNRSRQFRQSLMLTFQ